MIAQRIHVKYLIGGFLVAVVLVTASHHGAEGASAADFYKDKKISFMVAQTAGGGTDLITRITLSERYTKNSCC
ncbi:MAG: hypothetical protein L7F78_02660 [Syntrophales bacterium LBB04]|nr:hypothetical protein [Syntrophales bacterium LBB04]